MEIIVTGQHIQTGESLQTRVKEKLVSIAEKYDIRATKAQVTFTREPHDMVGCKIFTFVTNNDNNFTAHATAALAVDSFEEAANKLETQWRRYMRKTKDNKAERNKESHLDA